jgi:hypothetical protein
MMYCGVMKIPYLLLITKLRDLLHLPTMRKPPPLLKSNQSISNSTRHPILFSKARAPLPP